MDEGGAVDVEIEGEDIRTEFNDKGVEKLKDPLRESEEELASEISVFCRVLAR